jgi:hypothetical protein
VFISHPGTRRPGAICTLFANSSTVQLHGRNSRPAASQIEHTYVYSYCIYWHALETGTWYAMPLSWCPPVAQAVHWCPSAA